VSNDQATPIRFETRFGDDRKSVDASPRLIRRDGAFWWVVDVPANGRRTLRIRYRDPA